MGIRIGIDASNLRLGGGVTHIRELLGAASPQSQGVDRVVMWGGARTLAARVNIAIGRCSIRQLFAQHGGFNCEAIHR
jgi:hypothetical protein